jgi:3-hydroxyacyl-CoA dehydrogenase
MLLNDYLRNVGIVGAAGNMGSGIALLIAQEMILQKLLTENNARNYMLHLIDVDSARLEGLLQYLRAQSTKYAERSIVTLRNAYHEYSDLIENHEFIQQFVNDLLLNVRVGTDLNQLKNCQLIFEAVIEKANLKVSILKKLNRICSQNTFYLTNTSSIPISYLSEKAGLNGRIIGYHFYNPPVVQKLVEVISPKGINSELQKLGQELGKQLRKILIPSNDIAGFIGNGHFMRDGLHALLEVEKIQKSFNFVEAVYIMNRISQDFLIRPMGIFQLIDYVGIDVFQCILKSMNPHFPKEDLHHPLIDKVVRKNVLGGQYPDGSQKDGFLKYEKNRPVGVFDMKKSMYVRFDQGNWKDRVDEKIGNPPKGCYPWRLLLSDSAKEEKLLVYFQNLQTSKTMGANLALAYLRRSKAIGEQLVADGVAQSADDVNGVLLNGFYHLYGSINRYV